MAGPILNSRTHKCTNRSIALLTNTKYSQGVTSLSRNIFFEHVPTKILEKCIPFHNCLTTGFFEDVHRIIRFPSLSAASLYEVVAFLSALPQKSPFSLTTPYTDHADVLTAAEFLALPDLVAIAARSIAWAVMTKPAPPVDQLPDRLVHQVIARCGPVGLLMFESRSLAPRMSDAVDSRRMQLMAAPTGGLDGDQTKFNDLLGADLAKCVLAVDPAVLQNIVSICAPFITRLTLIGAPAPQSLLTLFSGLTQCSHIDLSDCRCSSDAGQAFTAGLTATHLHPTRSIRHLDVHARDGCVGSTIIQTIADQLPKRFSSSSEHPRPSPLARRAGGVGSPRRLPASGRVGPTPGGVTLPTLDGGGGSTPAPPRLSLTLSAPSAPVVLPILRWGLTKAFPASVSLDLSGSYGLGDNGAVALASIVRRRPIVSLLVDRCGLTSVGMSALLSAAFLSGVTTLSVKHNAITPDTPAGHEPGLPSHSQARKRLVDACRAIELLASNPTLTHLDVGHTIPNRDIASTLFTALAARADAGHRLTELGVAGWFITPSSAEMVLRHSVFGNLDTLDISEARFIVHDQCDPFQRFIVPSICKTTTIRTLTAHRLELTSDPIITLGVILHNSPNLTTVDLTDTALTSSGAHAIARGLGHNTTLECLILAGCEVQHSGAVSLFRVLPGCGVRRLDLSRNDVGAAGCRACVAALERTGRSVVVDLSGNRGVTGGHVGPSNIIG